MCGRRLRPQRVGGRGVFRWCIRWQKLFLNRNMGLLCCASLNQVDASSYRRARSGKDLLCGRRLALAMKRFARVLPLSRSMIKFRGRNSDVLV